VRVLDDDGVRRTENAARVGVDGKAVIKDAFTTDVTPLVAMARRARGGAADPVAVYRAGRYRDLMAKERPAPQRRGAGIV